MQLSEYIMQSVNINSIVKSIQQNQEIVSAQSNGIIIKIIPTKMTRKQKKLFSNSALSNFKQYISI